MRRKGTPGGKAVLVLGLAVVVSCAVQDTAPAAADIT